MGAVCYSAGHVMPAPENNQSKSAAAAAAIEGDSVCFAARDFRVRVSGAAGAVRARLSFAVDHDKVVSISLPEPLAIALGKQLRPQPMARSLLPQVEHRPVVKGGAM